LSGEQRLDTGDHRWIGHAEKSQRYGRQWLVGPHKFIELRLICGGKVCQALAVLRREGIEIDKACDPLGQAGENSGRDHAAVTPADQCDLP